MSVQNRAVEPVLAANLTGTETLYAGPGRLRGYAWIGGATAGSLTFKDGGASGSPTLVVYTPASAAAADSVMLPGSGIAFATDLHVTFSNAAGVTAIYAKKDGMQ